MDATFLAAAKKLVPGARVYADWRELLAAEGDRIDSVNVSTPDHVARCLDGRPARSDFR